MTGTWDAVVVGSGPNGLVAAVTVARAGHRVLLLEAADTVGGGLRSDDFHGLVRDRCAAVMPFAIESPAMADLDLASHGLEWATPQTQFTQPLDNGRVGASLSNIDATAALLGRDATRYKRTIGPFVDSWSSLLSEIHRPISHIPKHPLLLARFGISGIRSSRALAGNFETAEARALLAGCAAHGVLPLSAPFTSAFASLFAASAHAVGWPVAVGGSQKVADALLSIFKSLGGEVRTGSAVKTLRDIPPHRAVIFDLDPHQVVAICGQALPSRYGRRLRRFRFGPGIFKIDHVLDGPVPWADPYSGTSGTVHVGGTFEETMEAESAVASGHLPDHPFVLVAQQAVADPSRIRDGKQLLWSYTHVPHGSTVDRTDAVEAQIERFAPGFRDRILHRSTTTTAQLHHYNPNCVGGDITGGSHSGTQLLVRPRLFNPYSTPNESVFICSSSTPPGGGIHGMGGYNAGKVVLGSRLA